ncbi:SiaB family protein kinase [Aurantibacillus circumpalustris]|uniref:SiaB family protein kinase n=1 Tax=Aurantibacillus circumpalustris TaxID=3036359 RepID=UPI00295ACED0|nr:SiaB family protein kinase [Aurantibacillus circumpalustris]
MESTINIYDIYKTMSENKIILIYQGLFDQAMIKSVISMTEKKLIQENIEEGLRRKLFNVMVEGLQNISKHQMVSSENNQNPFLMIGKDETSYNVVTGNFIRNEKISVVKDKIDFINTLNKEELKEHYKTARLNSIISEVGGAGLGFIDMVRKSGNRLDYKFYVSDANLSFFILHSKISNN